MRTELNTTSTSKLTAKEYDYGNLCVNRRSAKSSKLKRMTTMLKTTQSSSSSTESLIGEVKSQGDCILKMQELPLPTLKNVSVKLDNDDGAVKYEVEV